MKNEIKRNGLNLKLPTGKNISILEMSKIIPQLMREYTITMAEPNQEWKTENYWFVKQTGLECRILRRDKTSK